MCAKGLRWEGDLQAKPGHDVPGAAVWVSGKVTAQSPSSAGENSSHKPATDLGLEGSFGGMMAVHKARSPVRS